VQTSSTLFAQEGEEEDEEEDDDNRAFSELVVLPLFSAIALCMGGLVSIFVGVGYIIVDGIVEW